MSEATQEAAEHASELLGAAPPSLLGASRTAALQVVARGVLLVLAVASTSLLTHALGVGYAAWATVLISVTLASVLIEPGLSPVIARRLSTTPELAPSSRSMGAVRGVLGLAALGLVVLTSVASRGSGVLLLALCLGAQVIGRSLVNNATGWLLADQRLHRLALLEVVASALGLLGLVVGIRAGLGAPALGLVAYAVPYGLLAVASNREIRRSPSSRRQVVGADRARVGSLFRETLPLTGAIALGTLYVRSSVFFVNRYEGDAEASRFFFSFLFAEQSMTIAGITAGALLPLLARQAVSSDLFAHDRTPDLLLTVTAIGVGVAGLLIGASAPLTTLVGGDALAGSERYIRLLAPFAVIMMPAMVLAYAFISAGLARRYLVFGAVGLCVNLLLSLLWIPQNGALASARITWATELVVVLLPLTSLVRTSRKGLVSGTEVVLLILSAVGASELAGRELVAPTACALALMLVGAVAGYRPLRRLASKAPYA